MNNSVLLIFLIITGLSVVSSVNADIRQGLWRFETSMEMKGMPMQLPTQTRTVCVKEKDYVPHEKKLKKNKDCKYKQEKDGNSISWHMSCTNPKMVQKGNVKYMGRRMQGSLVTTVYQRGRKVLMTVKINGQHLGSCKK